MYKISYICPKCGVITDIPTACDITIDEIYRLVDFLQGSTEQFSTVCSVCGRSIETMNYCILLMDDVMDSSSGQISPIVEVL